MCVCVCVCVCVHVCVHVLSVAMCCCVCAAHQILEYNSCTFLFVVHYTARLRFRVTEVAAAAAGVGGGGSQRLIPSHCIMPLSITREYIDETDLG